MSNKKLLILNICILVIGLLIWKLSTSWSTMGMGEKFIVFMLLFLAIGVPGVAYIVPQIGDKISDFFYNAPEQVEPDPYEKAAAKLSAGDYNGAIRDYRNILKDNPNDRFAVIEISKIQHEKLNKLEESIQTIEQAVNAHEWPDDDAAFFFFRLSDLHVNEKQDAEKAKQFLNEVIARFPDTRHSANATHKLHEIEQAVYHR